MSSTVVHLPATASASFAQRCEKMGATVRRDTFLTPKHQRVERPVLRRPGHEDVVGMQPVHNALKQIV